MSTKRYYIIAGSEIQFELVCRALDVNPREQRRVTEPSQLQGVTPQDVIVAEPRLDFSWKATGVLRQLWYLERRHQTPARRVTT